MMWWPHDSSLDSALDGITHHTGDEDEADWLLREPCIVALRMCDEHADTGDERACVQAMWSLFCSSCGDPHPCEC